MKALKKIIVTCTALSLILGSTISVSAADVKDIFDATYYAEQNPDVVAAVGNDADALYKHYVSYGMKEGRACGVLFDLNIYRKTYPDLEKAFGDDLAAYVNHYLNYGITEGRDGGGVFDAVTYANRYADVKEEYGYDIKKLYTHYQVFGIKENRDSLSQTVTDIIESQGSDSVEYSAAVQNALDYIAKAEDAWTAYNQAIKSESVEDVMPYVDAYNEILYDLFDAVDQLTMDEMHDVVSPAMGEAYDRNGEGFLSELAYG